MTHHHRTSRHAIPLPYRVALAGAVVRESRKGEQQVRQPIEIDHENARDLALVREVNHAPFSPPADGAGEMEDSGLRTSSGKDECAERCKFGLGDIDDPL